MTLPHYTSGLSLDTLPVPDFPSPVWEHHSLDQASRLMPDLTFNPLADVGRVILMLWLVRVVCWKSMQFFLLSESIDCFFFPPPPDSSRCIPPDPHRQASSGPVCLGRPGSLRRSNHAPHWGVGPEHAQHRLFWSRDRASGAVCCRYACHLFRRSWVLRTQVGRFRLLLYFFKSLTL